MKTMILATLCLFLAGCDEQPNDEVGRLKTRIYTLEQENLSLRAVAPSEQPRIVKELAEAKEQIMKLASELAHAREDLLPEVQPLSASIKNLQARIAVLERTASRKGHAHLFRDTDGKSDLQLTGPDE